MCPVTMGPSVGADQNIGGYTEANSFLTSEDFTHVFSDKSKIFLKQPHGITISNTKKHNQSCLGHLLHWNSFKTK